MPNSFTVKIAGIVIKINPIFDVTVERFKEYIVDNTVPDLCIRMSEEDLEAERVLNGVPEKFKGDQVFEQIAIQRAIADRLPEYNAFLVHGSAISVDDEAYILMAPSGTGKSTHASLWRKMLDEKAVMINDDKPFIRLFDDVPYVCGNPWMGKHFLGRNIIVPLKAICLIDRSCENHIEKINSIDCLPRLLSHVYRTSEPETLAMTMTLLDRIISRTNIYKLECNTDISAAEISYRFMSNSEN